MKLFFLLIVIIAYAEGINEKHSFCNKNQCFTCIGRFCVTTCEGEDCKNCPTGDCCNGGNCNICRGSKCCSSSECNSCINSCLLQCQKEDTCHHDCFQKCIPNNHKIQDPKKLANILINNNNYHPVNVTTIINITNAIHSENSIQNPIFVNTTNVNTVTGNKGQFHRKEVIISNVTKPDCCEIIHPEICQKIESQVDELCYTGKHRECTKLCKGRYVHIIENENFPSNCVYIAKHPFLFCGHYAVENCDPCYYCSTGANCSQIKNCPESCKESLPANTFYNQLYNK